jgi:protein TonB
MTPASDFFRTLRVSGKGLALLGSVSMHVAVALAAGRGAPHAALNASAAAEPNLEIAVLELAIAEAAVPLSAIPTRPPARHHHHYPVPPDHDATAHHPSIRHVVRVESTPNPAPAATPVVIDSPSPSAPRFVMTVSPRARAPVVGASADRSVDEAGQSAPGEPAPETSVDTPAKLLAGVAARYTLEAETAGVEADVPLEIVIDSAGVVISARAISQVGYGLDEAALRSIRAYRFSPARRAGKALAVRMRWLMRFQLR